MKILKSLKSNDIDLIAGGPPCQGFSLAGRRNPDDIRNQLPWQFIELVERINPKMVLIDPLFLKSLPKYEIRSGVAEMLKHGLIKDAEYWKRLSDLKSLNLYDLECLIYESVVIKNEIVKRDPNEHGERKQLNFGHTLGHAIESYFLNTEKNFYSIFKRNYLDKRK